MGADDLLGSLDCLECYCAMGFHREWCSRAIKPEHVVVVEVRNAVRRGTDCPRCRCPGALIGLASVFCVNTRCPCYHEPSRRRLDDMPAHAEFGGESVFWLRRWLWTAENKDVACD